MVKMDQMNDCERHAGILVLLLAWWTAGVDFYLRGQAYGLLKMKPLKKEWNGSVNVC